LVEIESINQGAHFRDEIGMFRQFIADLIELELDRADMAKLSKADQLLDMPDRRP